MACEKMTTGDYCSNETSRLYFPLTFEAEKKFDVDGFKEWIDNSSHYSLYLSVVYLILTRLGFDYMERRAAYKVKYLLVLWNLSLALVSIWGASRTVPELLHVIKHRGYVHSLCDYTNYEKHPETVCAVYVFCVLKVVELFDTVFLILRKSTQIFFHRIHHSFVFVFSWYLVRDRAAMGRWFLSINYTIHSFMYTYYALRVLGARIPKAYFLMLGIAQVAQCFLGLGINVFVFSKWLTRNECAVTGRVLAMGMSLFLSLVLLISLILYLSLIQPEAYKDKSSTYKKSKYLLEGRFTQKLIKLT